MKQQLHISIGDLLQIKRADIVLGDGIATVNGPPGRYLVMLAVGVTDKNVPFALEDMLRALGWQPIPKGRGDFSGTAIGGAFDAAPEKEVPDEH